LVHRWSLQLAASLQRELDLGPGRTAVVAYGLEILLGTFLKLIHFLTIPFILGIGPQTVVGFLTAAFFRLPTGGAHLSSYWKCLLGSLGAFMAVGALSKALAEHICQAGPVVMGSLAVAVLAVILFAPADTPARPVQSREERIRMRLWAFLMVLIYLIVWLSVRPRVDLALAGSIGLLVQSLTLTTWGYRFMRVLDSLPTKRRWANEEGSPGPSQ